MRNDHLLVCWRIVKVHRIIKIVFLIIRIDFIAVNLRACAKCVSFPSHISIFVHLQSTLDGLLLKHVAIHSVAFKKTLSETRCEVRKQENVCNDSEGNVFIKISYFIKIADNYFQGREERKIQFNQTICTFHRPLTWRSLSLDVKDDKMRKYFYAMRKMSFKVIFSSHAYVLFIESHVKNDFIFPHSPNWMDMSLDMSNDSWEWKLNFLLHTH